VKEWYTWYLEYKEENLTMIEEDISHLNFSHPLINNADCSLMQDMNKIDIVLTEESKEPLKPISFLDDTIISTK
jgi:hypothetical protein